MIMKIMIMLLTTNISNFQKEDENKDNCSKPNLEEYNV